jgi:hypothetical protein
MDYDTGRVKPGWGAHLRGDPDELVEWEEKLPPVGDPWIEPSRDGPLLRSCALNDATSAQDARGRAALLVEKLNGIAAIVGLPLRLRFEGIVQIADDGRLHRTLFADPGKFCVSPGMGTRAIVRRPDGVEVPPGPPKPTETQQWMGAAASDPPLRDALGYLGKGLDWPNIYKVVECLEAFGGGERALQQSGWASANKIKLLKRTANMHRHREGKEPPPATPMPPEEARQLIRHLVRQALQHARP